MHQFMRDLELYDLGVIVNAAMHNPDVINKLNPVRPKGGIDYSKVKGMLKIPKASQPQLN